MTINRSQTPADVTMTEVTLNQEDHSYMFDDHSTPVKACTELGYHVTTGSAFFFVCFNLSFRFQMVS